MAAGRAGTTPRILVVTTSFPASDDDPSGHFVRSHARALAAAGAQVHVVAPSASDPAPDPAQTSPLLHVHRAGGASLFTFPGAAARAAQNPLRLAGLLVFAAGVRRHLRELAPFDRLVAHWIVPTAWPLLGGTTAPLEVMSHGADVRLLVRAPAALRSAVLGSLLDRGARFQFVATHLLHTLASSLRPDLADRLRAASRVEPAPIELPDVAAAAAQLRASLALGGDEHLAVCVGRLVPEKRYKLAVAAVAASSMATPTRAGPHVRLAIVGDGPERARLEALAAASGVRTLVMGAAPRRVALAWIAAADVLLHTSESEGAPTVVREARALGTRVIACAAGDLERWAREDAGITIVPSDPRAIGEALRAAVQ